MKIKRLLKVLLIVSINFFYFSIYSADQNKKNSAQETKVFSGDIQKNLTDLIDKAIEQQDNLNPFSFLKISKKDDEKNKENYFLKTEEKVENSSQNYHIWGKKITLKTFEKLRDFVQDRANLFFSIKSDDTIKLDKIGAASAGLTAMIVVALKKRSSFSQRTIFPALSGWVIYQLVSTNQELKKTISKKMDFLKNKIM